ncbi:sodium:calcium antiporter [Alteraurantiacibacter aquimixticola]|uniref:Sodium:calcium antiporter n=1 Tax=Alteraurantiacibacter aquimixticola TaxID=2489173 RepID=A0A4T3F0Y5_9SPHN|nr:sodium:calcium antiporter [Alteraurantiacibacter aquimixticola]TIX50719.1 sodium:calcium antiporter [Alteraurantiacibacter aquimixticola]
MAALIPWLQLAACALAIGFAGAKLTRYAAVISDRTGLPSSWIGLVLLSTATSLPELFTGISSVVLFDAPDIAMGDALGSCILNLGLLVALDALSRDESIYCRVDQRHVLTAGFGLILIGIVGATILTSGTMIGGALYHVSVYSPLIIMIYLVSVRASFIHERRLAITSPTVGEPDPLTLRQAAMRYLAAAAVVAIAGSLLPSVGLQIVALTGWQVSFVGTLLVAMATSLPEFVVIVTALRRNAADMAIAALLGSNLFDILVIALDDIAYNKGSIFAAVSPANAASALAAVIMYGIFIVALLYRPRNRFFGTLSWASLSLLTVYFFSAYFIYLYAA